MENLILLDNIKQKNSLNIDIDKKVDFVEDRNRTEFTNVVSKVIDSGTNYIIKALPVNDSIKDTQINKYSLIKENKKFIYRNIFEKFREKFWKKSNNYARYFIKNRSVSFNKI